jgi:DNA transformation protein and related proteins
VAHPALIELCLELLAPLGQVRARRMFGGHGIYAGDLFIAIFSADQLYLKTDELTRPTFEAAGGLPFVYEARGRRVALSFSTPPVDALDSADAMAPWGRLALAAARRTRLQRSAASPRRAPAQRPARRAS